MPFDLVIEKHVKYFKRVLGILPAQYESEDSNKLAIIYFCLNALSLMGRLDGFFESHEHRLQLIDYIYEDFMVPSGEGFRGSPLYKLGNSADIYDPANLAATFFALNVLFLLGDDSISKRIDREKIMRHVAKCQLPSGDFCPMLDANGDPTGDTDLRYSMIAVSIRMFLQYQDGPHDIDIQKLTSKVFENLAYDGGFGSAKFQEAHAGLTFCGLTTLKIIDKISDHDWDTTIDYLVHRQVRQFDDNDLKYEFNDEDDTGGFNGRPNKFGDTCYTFWCLGSLTLITGESSLSLVNGPALIDFLSRTQNTLLGGFNKTTDPDERPDPLHSFLGLVTLSILNSGDEAKWSSKDLKKINVEYMLEEEVVAFIRSVKW